MNNQKDSTTHISAELHPYEIQFERERQLVMMVTVVKRVVYWSQNSEVEANSCDYGMQVVADEPHTTESKRQLTAGTWLPLMRTRRRKRAPPLLCSFFRVRGGLLYGIETRTAGAFWKRSFRNHVEDGGLCSSDTLILCGCWFRLKVVQNTT